MVVVYTRRSFNRKETMTYSTLVVLSLAHRIKIFESETKEVLQIVPFALFRSPFFGRMMFSIFYVELSDSGKVGYVLCI